MGVSAVARKSAGLAASCADIGRQLVSRTSGYFSANPAASLPIAICEKSKGALIRSLPRGRSPPEAIAAAVSSSSVSNAPVRSKSARPSSVSFSVRPPRSKRRRSRAASSPAARRDRGADVRALVRDPAKANFPAGVAVAQGDLLDVNSLRSAFSGVSTLFLLQGLQGRLAVDAEAHPRAARGGPGLITTPGESNSARSDPWFGAPSPRPQRLPRDVRRPPQGPGSSIPRALR